VGRDEGLGFQDKNRAEEICIPGFHASSLSVGGVMISNLNVPAIVLAGGKGTRLFELTDHECKPALSFGRHHKIIDFALSNARNSGFVNVLAATQYCPDTLHAHLAERWVPEFLVSGGALAVRHSGASDYTGTADAVFRSLPLLDAMMPEHVLVLAADHVYQMDYRDMLAEHVMSGADVTIAAHAVPKQHGNQFGIMRIDAKGRIRAFDEKPERPAAMPGDSGKCLASMGIYIFKWQVLRDALERDRADAGSSHDFGKDVLPRMIATQHAQCHRFRSPFGGRFEPYWRDVGTLDSYLAANLEVLHDPSLLDFERWPVFSLVRDDTVHPVSGRRSVISGAAIVNRGAVVNDCIVLDQATIGKQARLSNTIVLPGTRIPEGLVIGPNMPDGVHWFRRTASGTCLVSQDMVDSLALAAGR
jgi:glucose-1-phosphate adenylyltransferase